MQLAITGGISDPAEIDAYKVFGKITSIGNTKANGGALLKNFGTKCTVGGGVGGGGGNSVFRK